MVSLVLHSNVLVQILSLNLFVNLFFKFKIKTLKKNCMKFKFNFTKSSVVCTYGELSINNFGKLFTFFVKRPSVTIYLTDFLRKRAVFFPAFCVCFFHRRKLIVPHCCTNMHNGVRLFLKSHFKIIIPIFLLKNIQK